MKVENALDCCMESRESDELEGGGVLERQLIDEVEPESQLFVSRWSFEESSILIMMSVLAIGGS